MKPCKDKQLLSDHLDRRLAPNLERMIEEHLRLCTDCNQEWQELMLLRKLSVNLPEEELPDDLHRQIMQQLQKYDRSAGKIIRIRRIAVPLAAAVLLLLFVKGLPGILRNTKNGIFEQVEREHIIMATPQADDSFDAAAGAEQSLGMAAADEGERSSVDIETAESVNQLELEESFHNKDTDQSDSPAPEGSESVDSGESDEDKSGAGKFADRGGAEITREGNELPKAVKLGIGAVVLLAVVTFLIRNRKAKM